MVNLIKPDNGIEDPPDEPCVGLGGQSRGDEDDEDVEGDAVPRHLVPRS